MKKLLILLLLLPVFIQAQNISITDSSTHVVYRRGDVYRALPKTDVSIHANDSYLTVFFQHETIFTISNTATVTSPTSTNLQDLRNKILAIVTTVPSSGGGIGAADAATLTNKTMAFGSNTFTGFPYVGLTGNETVAGLKTLSSGLTLGGSVTFSANNTYSFGTSSAAAANFFVYQVLSPAGAVIGSNATSGGVSIRQGTSGNVINHWAPTTGNLILQPSGATPADTPSARLIVTSTTQGMLTPRLTQAQRDAIASPATSLLLYCTDCVATDGSTGVHQSWNGATWKNHW
jgi:hypothetical protein